MTTAVDTCVLLDYLLEDPKWGQRAEEALRESHAQGRLIIGEVVYAELMPQFRSAAELDEVLGELGIVFVPSSPPMAAAAGEAWASYRRRGGPRQRVVGDFLVGAHALTNADRLLTRDERFYKGCFGDLTITKP